MPVETGAADFLEMLPSQTSARDSFLVFDLLLHISLY